MPPTTVESALFSGNYPISLFFVSLLSSSLCSLSHLLKTSGCPRLEEHSFLLHLGLSLSLSFFFLSLVADLISQKLSVLLLRRRGKSKAKHLTCTAEWNDTILLLQLSPSVCLSVQNSSSRGFFATRALKRLKVKRGQWQTNINLKEARY